MANYANTVLLEARRKLNEMGEDVFNQRSVISQVEPAFRSGQKFIPNLMDLKEATTQATYIEYLKVFSSSLGTTKSCTPSASVADSEKVQVTMSSLVSSITISEKRHFGNDYKMAEALANLLIQHEKNMLFNAGGLEALMVAYLEANRTQVNTGLTGLGTRPHIWWAAPQYYVRCPLTYTGFNVPYTRFYNYLLSDFSLNNYVGELWDIHNIDWVAEVAYNASQGTANSVNTAFQFDGVQRQKTNHITPTGYIGHQHYIFRDGGVAYYTWNDPLNREGKTIGDKTWTTYQSKFIPGLTYDLFIYSTCADTSSSGGYLQDITYVYEFTINYSFAKMPLDVSNETPIVKYVNWTS